MPGTAFAVGTCMGLGCFSRIYCPMCSRHWNPRGSLCHQFGAFYKSICPTCKKQPLPWIQMQRKNESQRKENTFLKFYLGVSCRGFLWRKHQALYLHGSVNFRTSLSNANFSFTLLPTESRSLHSKIVWVLCHCLSIPFSRAKLKANKITFVLIS